VRTAALTPFTKENDQWRSSVTEWGRVSARPSSTATPYISLGSSRRTRPPDIKDQTEQVLRKIDGILKGVGSDKSKLLSAQIFITDMRNFADMNSVWDAWVDKQNTPARATVQASLANPKMLVEIMGQAAI